MEFFKLKKGIELSEFGDEIIIFNAETENAHVLNETAAAILRFISDCQSFDSIVDMLLTKYDFEGSRASKEQIQSDTLEILNDFINNNLVENNEAVF